MINELLDKARAERNRMTEKIIMGLKLRSEHKLNEGVFTEKAIDGRTWVEHLLYRYQSAHSEIGRYQFEDQRPFLFSIDQLPPSKVERSPSRSGLIPARINLDDKIVGLYRGLLPEICEPGEDKSTFGETAVYDCNNLLILDERIYKIARKVARGKISQQADIINEIDIRSKLRAPEIEDEVASAAVSIAKRELLPKPELMDAYFRGIMKYVVDVEEDYVLQFKEDYEHHKFPIGFSQVPRKPGNPNTKGWGSIQ